MTDIFYSPHIAKEILKGKDSINNPSFSKELEHIIQFPFAKKKGEILQNPNYQEQHNKLIKDNFLYNKLANIVSTMYEVLSSEEVEKKFPDILDTLVSKNTEQIHLTLS